MLGIDVVDIERLTTALQRSPGFAARFFSPEELAYCAGSAESLAGTFAAKEATMKALGLVPAVAWARRIEIERTDSGAPVALVAGREVTVSISHDGGVAMAVALDL